MDILYSSSDSYAFLTGISILSLLENNRECDAIHIYIMDNHISDINKNKLIEVVKEYRRDISFVPMPDMKELTGQEIDTRRWNISTFGRLYMASALPETVHKVLNKTALLASYYAYEYSVLLGVSAGVKNRELLGRVRNLQPLLDYDISRKVQKVKRLKKLIGYSLTRKALCLFVKIKK